MRRFFDTPRKKWLWILGAIAFAIVLYLPQYYPRFRVVQFSEVIITAIAVLGLGLLTGYNGQISVGHAAFFGVGAYTTAILVDNHGWPFLATIPVAVLASFVIGVQTKTGSIAAELRRKTAGTDDRVGEPASDVRSRHVIGTVVAASGQRKPEEGSNRFSR